MAEKEIPRSIRFPESLWIAIDSDAKRCKRSSVKQLEALVARYYELQNVEIDSNAIDRLQQENQFVAADSKSANQELRPADNIQGILDAATKAKPLNDENATNRRRKVS